jgi:multiple sugar transport system substrate-binding protein
VGHRIDRRGERSSDRSIGRSDLAERRLQRRSTLAALVAVVLALVGCTDQGAVVDPSGGSLRPPAPGQSASAAGAGSASSGESISPSPAFDPPASPVSLRLWNSLSGADADAFNSIVGAFNAANPTVHVTVEPQPAGEMQHRLQAAASKHAMPQLVVLTDDLIVPSATGRLIQPLDDFATQTEPFADDPDSEIWSAMQWRGQRYAIPIDVHPQALFWNKSLFRSAGLDPDNEPKDQASFDAAIKAIQLKVGVPGYMAVASGPQAAQVEGALFASLFGQGGGAWTSADFSTATYDSQAGVQAAEYLLHLVHDLKVPLVASGTDVSEFRKGDDAMLIASTLEISASSEALGKDLGVGVIPMIFGPGVTAGSHDAAVTVGVSGDELLGAYVFIDWLSQHSLELADAGEMPTTKAVRDQLTASGGGIEPLMAKVAPEMDGVQLLPTIPGGHDLALLPTGAGGAVVDVINGKADAATALHASARSFGAVLAGNKKQFGY